MDPVAQTPPTQPPTVVQPSAPRFLLPLLIAAGSLGLILIVASVMFFMRPKTNPQKSQHMMIAPTISEEPVPTLPPETPTAKPAGETAQYSSPENGYSFQYMSSWKVGREGSAVTLASPETQESSARYKESGTGDVIVSTVPYEEAPPSGMTISPEPQIGTHDEQAKNIASQMANGTAPEQIMVGKLQGYSIVSTADEGSTYNIVLVGTKQMLLVQFPDAAGKSSLNTGQMLVLSTLSEL